MDGIPPENNKSYTEIAVKAEISARLDYVRQFAYGLDPEVDSDLLCWLRNRLTETFRVVQKKTTLPDDVRFGK